MHYQAGRLTLIGKSLYLDDNADPIKLTRMEARLIALLMHHPNQTVSRVTIMKEVWQTDYLDDTRTLDVHISWLRRKLETDPARPQLIVTERKVGYRLCI